MNLPPSFRVLLCVGALLTASGCAPLQSQRLLATADAFPNPVELREVPFFPQEDYQCGPAALATVLNWSGVSVTPDQLSPLVYLPQRQGSLQIELLAATRRYQRVPYVLRPQIESLAAEVTSGNPVLVLQNLGLSIAPTWHYAVVVGLDLHKDQIVLRSGRDERHVVSLENFEYTWRRAQYWSAVTLPPDRLPFTAEELPYLQSVADIERLGMKQTAVQAYATALTRWPRSLPAFMGLGNTNYALGDLPSAEQAFRRATQFHPQSAPAYNNLAQTLADQLRYIEAESAARRALELDTKSSLRELYQKTLDDIQRATLLTP